MDKNMMFVALFVIGWQFSPKNERRRLLYETPPSGFQRFGAT